MISPERALFQAIIIRAIMDLKGDNPLCGPAAGKAVQRQAAAWLGGNSRDFQMICTFAGLNPDAVREAFHAGKLTEARLETAAAGTRGKK